MRCAWTRVMAVVGLAILVCVGVSGCIVIASSKNERPVAVEVPPSAYVSPRDVLTKEIDAAACLRVESARVEALKRIGGRKDLRADAQARVVWAAYTKLNTDSSKVEVIRTVLGNPAVGPEAKGAVLDGLKHLRSDSERAAMLAAVGEGRS